MSTFVYSFLKKLKNRFWIIFWSGNDQETIFWLFRKKLGKSAKQLKKVEKVQKEIEKHMCFNIFGIFLEKIENRFFVFFLVHHSCIHSSSSFIFFFLLFDVMGQSWKKIFFPLLSTFFFRKNRKSIVNHFRVRKWLKSRCFYCSEKSSEKVENNWKNLKNSKKSLNTHVFQLFQTFSRKNRKIVFWSFFDFIIHSFIIIMHSSIMLLDHYNKMSKLCSASG